MVEKKRKKSQQDKGSSTEEYSEFVLKVRRVAKVVKGGRRFAFSALVVVGDKKGSVGIALGKSREVSTAISKALRRARKDMFFVPLYKTTIPFTVEGKHGASLVLIRSASMGTGIIAGGAVRAIMEAIGVRDILAKSLGSSNSQNVVKAAINGLKKLRTAKQLVSMRGKTMEEIFGNCNVAT